jgi:hypothetical protein
MNLNDATKAKIESLGIDPEFLYVNAWRINPHSNMKFQEYMLTLEFAHKFLACALLRNEISPETHATVSVHKTAKGVSLFLSVNDHKKLRKGEISMYDSKVLMMVKDHKTGEETLHTAIGRYILGKAIELGIKVYYAQDWKVYKEKN